MHRSDDKQQVLNLFIDKFNGFIDQTPDLIEDKEAK